MGWVVAAFAVAACGATLSGCGTTPTPPIAAVDAAPPCQGIDLSQDPANCGVCGHDCQGGTCASGRCQPLQLVAERLTNRFVIDEANVYFVSSDPLHVSSLRAVPKGGGAPKTLISPVTCVGALTAAHGAVYFITNSCDSSLSANWLHKALGSGVGQQWEVPAPGYTFQIGAGGSDTQEAVYCDSGWDNTVRAISSDGTTLAAQVFQGSFWAVDAGALYSLKGGRFVRQPLPNGKPVVLTTLAATDAGSVATVRQVAVQAGVLAWLADDDPSSASASLYSVPAGGADAAPVELATNIVDATSLATDGVSVYVATRASLLRVPLAGGTPTVIATESVDAVAVDETSVYWSTSGAITATSM